jgi:ankyrin repeat protein
MSTLGKYKKSITDDFFVAYVMGDSSKQFDLWLNDDFDPNDIDSFGETLIMNVLYTYGSNTLKISEADFKESVGLIIGHEKYDPNQKNEFKETPLFTIARNPALNCVAKALLDIDGTKLTEQNDVGLNVFEVAMYNGNMAFAEMLLDTGKFDFMTQGQAEIVKKEEIPGHAQ